MTDPVRYAVVGLGHIAQVAVLPAFQNAENSELAALFSGDEEKRDELSERHGVPAHGYDEYERVLEEGGVDAVYVAVPNHLHRDYTVRAAERGVHVLCEKPMAVTEEECREMTRAAEEGDVRLMIAYRLHFDDANLAAAEIVGSGEIGDPRYFSSVFSQSVVEGDVRLMPIEEGGGSVYDMGVYCINAARYLFRDEPVAVRAASASRDDPRFSACDEMTSALLEFPGERLASFTSSFGAHDVGRYSVVGTEGEVRMEPAYGYATNLSWEVEADGGSRSRTYPKRDQFAPELIHFSDCVREGRDPEPDGREGLADVRIVRAVYEAARSGERIEIEPVEPQDRPRRSQAMERPGFEKPEEVRTSGPSEE